MKRIILLLSLYTQSITTTAQFSDSVHHYIKYAATGILNKTNDAKSYVLTNALNFNINQRKLFINNSTNWIYGRQDGQLINNDFSSGVNADFLKQLQRIYYWGLVSYTTSYSLNIHYQLQGGGGLGLNVFNEKDRELIVSDGILYEASSLDLDPNTRDTYHTFRNSLRIKYHFNIRNRFAIDGSHFWQPSLSSIHDYILRSNSSLSLKLWKWLSLMAVVSYNKISRTDRENLLVTIGLGAERYF